jgi:hypothetical protein
MCGYPPPSKEEREGILAPIYALPDPTSYEHGLELAAQVRSFHEEHEAALSWEAQQMLRDMARNLPPMGRHAEEQPEGA